jgi:hypothetical protein
VVVIGIAYRAPGAFAADPIMKPSPPWFPVKGIAHSHGRSVRYLVIMLHEGIFYLCNFEPPVGEWVVYADVRPGRYDRGHTEWWPVLLARARQSHTALCRLPDAVFETLAELPYAFPRGRLVALGTKHIIYWGGEPVVRRHRQHIQKAFQVDDTCHWVIDEHETTFAEESEQAQRLLKSTSR